MEMLKNRSLPVSLFIAILLAMLASCEDVIRLDLVNAESRWVIEGTFNASKSECTVQISKTLDFYEIDSINRIRGAKVELINGAGSVSSLEEIKPGVYRADSLSVGQGEICRLNVILSSGEKFTASTQVPVQVFLDSLKVVRGFGDPRPNSPPIYLLNLKWKDSAGLANYYRFKVTTNGKLRGQSFTILDDKPFEGKDADVTIYRYGFKPGDTVRFEFQSIDSVSFSYYRQINDMARPGFVSATPYNPVGNFNNGALGYFGIFYSDIRDTIISIGR